MNFGDIMGWLGTCISIIFYIAPIIPIMKLIKNKINIKEIPGPLLIMSFMNTILWAVYGLRDNKTQLYICNFIGGIISAIFIIIYIIYLTKLNWKLTAFYNLMFANIIIEIFYIFYKIINENNTIGLIAMLVNILMYAAPGAKIYQVFKTGNYDLIPIYSSIIALLNSICWLIYGISLKDVNVILPNASGVVLALIQIFVWNVFYNKKKNNNNLDVNFQNKTQY